MAAGTALQSRVLASSNDEPQAESVGEGARNRTLPKARVQDAKNHSPEKAAVDGGLVFLSRPP